MSFFQVLNMGLMHRKSRFVQRAISSGMNCFLYFVRCQQAHDLHITQHLREGHEFLVPTTQIQLKRLQIRFAGRPPRRAKAEVEASGAIIGIQKEELKKGAQVLSVRMHRDRGYRK